MCKFCVYFFTRVDAPGTRNVSIARKNMKINENKIYVYALKDGLFDQRIISWKC